MHSWSSACSRRAPVCHLYNQLIVLAFAVFADTQFVQTFNLLFVNDSLLKSQTDVPDCSLWTSGVRIGHLSKTSHSVQYVLLVWTTAILTVYLTCSINNHLQNYFLPKWFFFSVSTDIFQFEEKHKYNLHLFQLIYIYIYIYIYIQQ